MSAPEAPERPLLEVCVDTVAGVLACAQHVDRIELCGALALGGLTPGPGLLDTVAKAACPVHAMIRPRDGNFAYTAAEVRVCVADIAAARTAGCSGVVIGAARDGGLDLPVLSELVAAADELHCTLHRVIDRVDDPLLAIDQAAETNIETVLTSGGAAKAHSGLKRLAEMHAYAAGRLTIMAGSGVTAETAPMIAEATGINAFHGSCGRAVPSDAKDIALGFAGPTTSITDPEKIRALRKALDDFVA